MRGTNLKSRSLAWLLSLALILTLTPVAAFADGNVAAGTVVFLNSGYPYGKNMNSSTITLVIEAEASPASYQWQYATNETGEYNDINEATLGTYTFTPTSGYWYRCVVNGTASKAVMAVYPGQDERSWTKPYFSWYISNGTMAYMASGTLFDAVGLYKKNGADYMLCTSYGSRWDMFSSTEATPTAGDTVAASLDAFRVSFDDADDYAILFDADLAEGQQAFSFGCDTQLGNGYTSGSYSDAAALSAMVENGILQQVAMIGAGTVEAAEDTDPAFVIAPVDHASRFWIGSYSSRQTYAYNTSGGTATEIIDGQSVVTLVEGLDSGMTMSWLNVSSGGRIRFKFSVGDVAHTGAVSGKVDYRKEALTGLDPGTTYIITVDVTNYTVVSDSNGEIPLSGTDKNGNPYDFTGTSLTIAKQGSQDTPAEIDVAGRPETPGTPTTLPDDADKPVNVPKEVEIKEVTTDSVTIQPVSGQEYAYSTDGAIWTSVPSDNIITGLSGSTEVQIKTRIAATSSAPASAYSDPLTVALKTMIKNLEGFSAIGYTGDYDGEAHSITVTVLEGASVAYSNTSGLDYKETNPAYTNAGTYTVYYRVTKEGYYPVYGSKDVIINQVVYETPSAPTVTDFTVTINEADREKKLEYAVVTKGSAAPNIFVSVPVLDSNGSFDLTGLKESDNYTIYLRQKASADGNFKESASVSTDFQTPASYSVAYNANYGTGAVPASVTRNSGESVTVASGEGLKRTGYTFTNWNTVANPTSTNPGITYAPGDTINTGATLYAQWTANSYTVKYDVNGGTGSMDDQSLTYDVAAELSPENFAKEGYTFAGWATSVNGSVVYSDQQSVKNLASDGTVTLYAVWSQNLYGISGTITSDSNQDVIVKLMRGNVQFGSSQTVTMSAISASYSGTYNFSNIPAGTYNLVSEQQISGKKRTVTELLVVTDNNQTKDITMPSGNTNSILDVKEDTRPVVVGGLDSEAQTYEETGKSITITMTVEKKEEQQLPETATQSEQQTQEAIAEIKTEASGKTLEFMDIKVEQKIGAGTATSISQTNTVMEIVIPYNMTGKNNITVYRYHGGVTEAFTESDSRADGTFRLDRANSLIYVYAQKFSTYAIGYTVPTSGGSGGGGTVSYPVTVPDSSVTGGKISISQKYAAKGSKVTVSVEPEDGYQLDKLIVKDKNGNSIAVTPAGDGTYTFEMPYGGVTVEAAFREVFSWNTDYAGCLREDACPILPFTDTAPTAWFHDGVHFCLENGLMVGCSEKSFKPDDSTTRSMLAVILWRLNGSPVVNQAMDFADVSDDAWYTEAIRWALSEGIAGGYGNGAFGSADTLTREQMVTMLYRYASYQGCDVSIGEDTNILSYSDALDVSQYAVPAMQWACGAGVLQGKETDSGMALDPLTGITRAEMATLMMRFVLLYE